MLRNYLKNNDISIKETDNSRNGHSRKTMHTSYGDMDVAIPKVTMSLNFICMNYTILIFLAVMLKVHLGYNQSNADDLLRQIYEKLPSSEAVVGKMD